MAHAETLFQLLYVSHLAAGADFAAVAEIVGVARQRNPAHGITGALLFDGERFCQLIEGPEAEVGALIRRIALDPRHTAVKVIFEGMTRAGRTSRHWLSGYCDAGELEGFDREPTLAHAAALDAFLSLLARADVE